MVPAGPSPQIQPSCASGVVFLNLLGFSGRKSPENWNFVSKSVFIWTGSANTVTKKKMEHRGRDATLQQAGAFWVPFSGSMVV